MIKNKIRKIVSSFISCLVSLNIIFTLGCVNIYASTNSYNYDPSIISTYNGKIDTGYSYKGTFVASSINGNIEYDDAWFIDNYSYTYNHDISTFLYKAETASFHIFFTSDPAANIKKLFDTLGYKYTDNIIEGETLDSPDSIVYAETSAGFDYQDPSKDAFGYGIGYKNVKFDDGSIYTFIGIGTRGAGYETEWASNFTVGESGDHQGFKQAAKAVENKLIDIIDEIDTPYPICIWLTGYSRGGSVADILGNYLNEDALNNKLGNTKPENIFTYTFETPLSRDVNVNKNNTTYTFNNKTVNLNDNIFNVYNTIDFVASVPMEDLGFGQYGRPKVLPNSLTYPDYYNSSIYKKMKDNYKNNLLANYSTSGYANYVDEYVAQAPNQRELINTYTYLLSQLVNNSRSVFINDTNLQKTLRLILGGMESGRELSKIDVQYRYKPLIGSETNSGTITINLEDDLDIASIALDLISLISRFKNNQIRQYYITLHMSNEDGSEFGKEKVTLTADQFKLVYNALPSEITDCLDDISKLINMVSNYETELAEVEEYYSSLIDYVKYNHYPELDYAWMMSGNEEELFKNFTYNQVRIPAKANVYVKYKGNDVASIENGKITKEQLECFIDDNGDYVFDVPNNSDYTIEITLTGTSSKNIEVNTYNINTKQKLRDFKYSLSGGKSGDVFVLNMSKKSESLKKNSNNQTLSVNRYEDITDVVIKLDYDNTKANVSGNGKYTLYDYALLKTTPNTGYELDGYYNEHHKLLSEDSEYNHLAHDNETIYVEVNPIEYTITYDLGDAQDPGNPSTYTIESDDITLLEPSLDGYAFDGWTSSQIQTPTKVITIPKGSTGDESFVANFTPIEYTITYNLDGGTNNITNPSTYTIESKDITLLDPSKSGSAFIGWTSSEVKTPTKNLVIPSGSTGNKEFTANYYKSTEYKITYNLNGGTNNISNPSSYIKESKDITLLDAYKSGYTFIGWTSSEVKTPTKNLVIPSGSTGDKTFTANYTINTYNITYTLNGGRDTGNPSTYTVETDSFTLKAPVKTNYDFIGWTSSQIQTPTKVITISKGSVGDKSYTANYTPHNYSITYNLNGGSVSGTNKTTYNIETNTFTLINPTKNGYTFKGWTYSGQSTPQPTVTITKGTVGDSTYVANYEPITYNITYVLDGGTVTSNPSTYTIETNTFTLNNPTKAGYTFKGWTSSEVKTPTTTMTISKGSTGDKTFTANYELAGYSITYNLNGGHVANANPTSYNVETNTFTLNNPIKTGYTFKGWTYTGQSTPQLTVTISKGSTGTKSFTANYTVNTYNITYHLDGGTNNINNISTYTVETKNTILYNPTKSGYEFVGWYLDSAFKNKVASINVNTCADIDLYAKFVNDGMYVDVSGLGLKENDEVYVDGVLTSVNSDSKIFTSRTTKLLTTYTYKNALDSDVHANYPTSMKTYLLKYQKDGVGTVTHLNFLDNALIYAGTSIKITGNKGIRSITSIPTSLKNALTSSGINGYKAIEYGTIMGWASNLDENEEPTIYKQNDGTYKATKGTKAKAYDRATNYLMTYKEANGTSKYTNPLVGNFSNDDCSRDFAIRPYMILTDGTNEIVLYGGTLYRSISYVAYQCRNDFKPKTSSYEYVWNLIKAGYGDKYNAEYIH